MRVASVKKNSRTQRLEDSRTQGLKKPNQSAGAGNVLVFSVTSRLLECLVFFLMKKNSRTYEPVVVPALK